LDAGVSFTAAGDGEVVAATAAPAGVVAISASTATTVPLETKKSRLENFFLAAAFSLSAFLPPGIELLLQFLYLNVVLGEDPMKTSI
jgi:hypothetical protein